MRRRLLEAHRDVVRQNLAGMQASLEALDQKITSYAASGKGNKLT
jgi:hypothetical protein